VQAVHRNISRQTCLPADRDVKEDLKKLFLSTSQKYHSILIVREQQIYGFDQYMWEQNRYFANP
jgi:hypothetical protein